MEANADLIRLIVIIDSKFILKLSYAIKFSISLKTNTLKIVTKLVDFANWIKYNCVCGRF